MEIRTDALLQHPSITATNQNETSISENRRCKKSPPKVLAPFKSRITTSRALRTAAASPTNHAPLYGVLGFASSASAQDSQEGLRSEVALQKRIKKFISFFFNIFFSFPFLNTPPLRARSQKPTSRRPATTESGSLRS